MQALRYTPLAGVLAALAVPHASAQDGDDDPIGRAPERCITLNRVDRTEVIDDRTLIFHMRGGDIFLNHLARECPGLKREERFMYSPTGNRLCDVDTVTVLEQWGFGLTRGFTCSLGEFHPISDTDLEDLRRGEEGGESGGGDFEVVPVDPKDLETLRDSSDEETPADRESAEREAAGAGDEPARE